MITSRQSSVFKALATCCISGAFCARAAVAECEFGTWYPVSTSMVGGANALVRALLTTGLSPAQVTYAAGAFTQIGGVAANRVASWDGTTWRALGLGFDDGSVGAMAEFDDGTGNALYAAGSFTLSGGVAVNRIAKWTGSGWQSLGSGIADGGVNTLAVYDDGSGSALYVGGSFTSVDGRPLSRVAKWDGSAWSPVGLGVAGYVSSMAVFDEGKGPSVYVGGTFTRAGGILAQNMARWDGTSWSPVGSVAAGFGAMSTVYALAAFESGTASERGALFAGSSLYSFVNNVPSYGCAAWDGSRWTSAGFNYFIGGSNGFNYLRTLYRSGNGNDAILFSGGSFVVPSSSESGILRGIGRWNGSSWDALGVGVTNLSSSSYGIVYGITTHRTATSNRLLVGGLFQAAGGMSAANIGVWDLSSSQWLGSGSPSGPVLASIPDRDAPEGGVIVGGAFTTVGAMPLRRIARWDGSSWFGMGQGFDGRVKALHNAESVGSATVYAGGMFTKSGSQTVNGIAKWDGQAWAALGSGVDGTVLAIETDGLDTSPDIFAAGQFTTAGGQPCRNIARWDGQDWHALGSGLNGAVYALQYFGSGETRALYAGGAFTMAGGVPAAGVARWNGEQWSPVGGGIIGSIATVYALKSLAIDGTAALAVGGAFDSAGTIASSNVALWTGAEWLALGSGVGGPVFSFECQEYGAGQTIYAGGSFGDVSTGYGVARWDGSAWQSMGPNIGDAVQTLCLSRVSGHDTIFVGGNFSSSQTGDMFLSSWRRCIPCNQDLNADRGVDGSDLGLLLGSWGNCRACTADFDGDGAVSGADLGLLLGAWGPCPE